MGAELTTIQHLDAKENVQFMCWLGFGTTTVHAIKCQIKLS